jgi:hypothetical protein
MTPDEHLSEWMRLQEEANKEITRLLLSIDERLKRCEHHVFMNSPIGPKPKPFRVPKDDATLDAIIDMIRTE